MLRGGACRRFPSPLRAASPRKRARRAGVRRALPFSTALRKKRRPPVVDGFFHLPSHIIQLAFEPLDLFVHLFLCHTTNAQLTRHTWCGHYVRTARTNSISEFCHAHSFPSLAGLVCFFNQIINLKDTHNSTWGPTAISRCLRGVSPMRVDAAGPLDGHHRLDLGGRCPSGRGGSGRVPEAGEVTAGRYR